MNKKYENLKRENGQDSGKGELWNRRREGVPVPHLTLAVYLTILTLGEMFFIKKIFLLPPNIEMTQIFLDFWKALIPNMNLPVCLSLQQILIEWLLWFAPLSRVSVHQIPGE